MKPTLSYPRRRVSGSHRICGVAPLCRSQPPTISGSSALADDDTPGKALAQSLSPARGMRRRDVIALFGGATVASSVLRPLPACAQQGAPMRRIGVLMPTAADDREFQTRLTAFLQELQRLGWTDGRNVHIDIRWGVGDPEQIRRLAQELVALAPDVILCPRQRDDRTVVAGNPLRADRVRDRSRSGRCGLRREPGAAGRQRHRLHGVRIRHRRQMAGTAQADRAGRDARGRASGCRHIRRDRSVRRHPVRGAVSWRRTDPDQHAR